MDIAKRNRDDQLIGIGLGTVPDLVIAFAAMKLTDNEWGTFWWAFLAIQALYLLYWAKNAIWGLIVWRTWGRNREIERASAVLKAFAMPRPSGEESVAIYFQNVKDNPDIAIATRIHAAEMGATMEALSQRGFAIALRLNSAWDAALARYPGT